MDTEKLIQLGGSVWKKDSYHRIYFNLDILMALYGLKVSRYGTGNISYATLEGDKISNTAARKILDRLSSGKFWYDVPTGKFAGKGFASETVELFVKEIESRLNPTEE